MTIAILNCDLDEDQKTNGGFLLKKLFSDSIKFDYHRGEKIQEFSRFSGFIITGSRAHVTDSYSWISKVREAIRQIRDSEKPCLGICFGMQIVVETFGGIVQSENKELGFKDVTLNENPLFDGLSGNVMVYQSHSDSVVQPPHGAVVLAKNATCLQAFLYENFLCVQFHPEINAPVAMIMASRDADPKEEILNGVAEDYSLPEAILDNFMVLCSPK